MISEAMYCEGNPYSLSHFNLNSRHQCMFTSHENFHHVTLALGHLSISTINIYLTFIVCIPLVNNLFCAYSFDSQNIFVICFMMALEAFQCYTLQNYVFYKDRISLCGYYSTTVTYGTCCADNDHNVDSNRKHTADCLSYQYVFLEVLPNNFMPPDPFYIFQYVSTIALDSNNINLMFHMAFTDCTWSIVSAGVIPKASLKSYVAVPKNDRYFIAKFHDETDGTLFSKWLSRPDAVKVS